jgi:hypothetical protein
MDNGAPFPRSPEIRSPMFNFEKLDVWHKAIEFADLIYALTRTFPDTERFALTTQMRRSRADFVRFIEIATGSLFEVVSQASIALRQALITQEQHRQVYEAAEQLGKMLSGLRRSLAES